MGKNHSKKKPKTFISTWDSLMRRTENEIAEKEKLAKKSKYKK